MALANNSESTPVKSYPKMNTKAVVAISLFAVVALILTAVGVASQYELFPSALQEQVVGATQDNLEQIAESVQQATTQAASVVENHADSRPLQPSQQAVAVASVSQVRPPFAAWKIVLITLGVFIFLALIAVMAYYLYRKHQYELEQKELKRQYRIWLEEDEKLQFYWDSRWNDRAVFIDYVPFAAKLAFAVGFIYAVVDKLCLSNLIHGGNRRGVLYHIIYYRAFIAAGVALIASVVVAVLAPSWAFGIPVFAAAVAPLIFLQGLHNTGVARWVCFVIGLVAFAAMICAINYLPEVLYGDVYEREINYHGTGALIYSEEELIK